MSSVYYALVLENRSFLNLFFYQVLLFRLHLTEYVNYLVTHPQKNLDIFTVEVIPYSMNLFNWTKVVFEKLIYKLLRIV